MKKKPQEIESESRFLWKLLFELILLPITLIMVLSQKRKISDLFSPIREIFHFLFEPRFAITLIIINIITFFVSVLYFTEKFYVSLLMYPSNVFSSKFYTIFTAGFLHADLAHLGFNMLALFLFGRVVERKLGIKKTALIYFGALIISAVFEAIIFLITKNDIPGLGASGAIMGIVSAAMLIDPFYLTYELIIPLPVMIAGWLAIYADITGILSRIDDGIGHVAHLGGFLSIGIIVFLMSGNDKSRLKKGFIINIISLVAIAALYFFVLKKYF